MSEEPDGDEVVEETGSDASAGAATGTEPAPPEADATSAPRSPPATEDEQADGNDVQADGEDEPTDGMDEPTDEEDERADREDEWSNGDDDDEPSVAGVFGARPEDAPPRPEIVPESPSLENALFVLLGVLLGLFVIYRAVVAFAG